MSLVMSTTEAEKIVALLAEFVGDEALMDLREEVVARIDAGEAPEVVEAQMLANTLEVNARVRSAMASW